MPQYNETKTIENFIFLFSTEADNDTVQIAPADYLKSLIDAGSQ